jgi:hypothetical protein
MYHTWHSDFLLEKGVKRLYQRDAAIEEETGKCEA